MVVASVGARSPYHFNTWALEEYEFRVCGSLKKTFTAVNEKITVFSMGVQEQPRERVEALCAALDLQLLSFDFLPEGHPGCTFGESEGCTARPFNVNPNWALSVRSPGGERALILQVSNPHTWRKTRNTESKVAAMQFLKQHGIPLIPEVAGLLLRFSSESGSFKCVGGNECEYMYGHTCICAY